MITILQNCKLIDGYSTRLYEQASVIIDDDQIADVFTYPIEIQDYPSADIVDLNGDTLLPGLIDSHVHLVYSASKNPAADFHAEKKTHQLEQRVESNAKEALKAGITTLRDCGGWNTVVQTVRNRINTNELVGPRILSSGVAITTPDGHLRDMGVLVNEGDSIPIILNKLIESDIDFVKIMASGGNSDGDATQPQFSEDQLRLITKIAHSNGLKVSAHLHSSIGTRRAFHAGIDTFEHCSWLALRKAEDEHFRMDYDESIVERMVDQGVIVCPATGHNFRVDPEAGLWYPEKNKLLNSFMEIRSKTTHWMHEAGIPIIIGTDAGCNLTRFEDFAEVFPIFINRLGLEPIEAILAATGIAAKALGISDQVGTIEKGKMADLVVVQGNPVNNINAIGQVRKVYRNGKLVVEEGKQKDNN